MIKVYAAAAIIGVFIGGLAGAFIYGKSVERAAAAEEVTRLQQDLAALGLVVQKQQSEKADNARKIIELNQGKLNAIQTTDHQASTIQELEQKLQDLAQQQAERAQAAGADKSVGGPVRVILPGATVRVWEQARSCSGLPFSAAASVLQKRLSAVAGDDINRSIKYLHGQYCGCALKYNALWRACDQLLEQRNVPLVSE